MHQTKPVEKLFDFFDTIYPMGPKAKNALEKLIREKDYVKNEIVQELGSRCRTIYIVKTGGARIFYYKDGTDITEHLCC